MPRDEGQVAAAFDGALRLVVARTWVAHLLTAGAAASAAAVCAWAAPPLARMSAATAAGVAVLWIRRGGRTRRRAARLIEGMLPSSRNLVITAEELTAHPERASDWMRARVLADALGVVSDVRPSSLQPLTAPVLLALAAVAAAAFAFTGEPRVALSRLRGAVENAAVRIALTSGPALVVTIEPPGYTGLPTRRIANPERIEAIDGSVLRVSLRTDAAHARVRFGTRTLASTRRDDRIEMEWRLTESGYLAIDSDSQQIVPVVVTPDRAPAVRIEAPARDLLVPDATRAIHVTASATDDLALGLLELRYTKVSGTGEEFEFVEGTLPVRMARESGASWRAAADIALGALGLEPGDSLVYRAVARDLRPGADGESSSDTFFVEVAGPGRVALEGFELPPELERYALSQQMVVLKIERLRGRERSLGRELLREQAEAIAAEQRAVRANFVFLMGGHVEDEEVEAEQSNEIQEGRLENSARREISSAIHLMTRAEQGLVAVNTGAALPPAKSAVDALQRAFGRNRYILRTPPSRSRIDPSRRLSGGLAGATPWRRELSGADPDPQARHVNAFIADLLALARTDATGTPPAVAALTALAERAIAIDPASADWQKSAAALISLRDLVQARRGAGRVETLIEQALQPALAYSRTHARPSGGDATRRATPLASAWAGEGRR